VNRAGRCASLDEYTLLGSIEGLARTAPAFSGIVAMKIVGRWQDLVHTHFRTDAVRLTSESTREIERRLRAVLRANAIVFGMHFAQASRGIEIVLECQPDSATLDRVRHELASIVEPIPIKPPTLTSVTLEAR
jgi:hypothetical protein